MSDVDGIVRAMARRYSQPPVVDADDLIQEARIALIGFDGEPALAICKARTAMIDALRHMLGRKRTGTGKPSGRYMVNQATSSYDAWTNADGEAVSNPIDLMGCHPSAEAEALVREEWRRTLEAIRRLPEREREAVLTRLSGETLVEAGKRHGVGEARMWQIQQRGLEALQAERRLSPSEQRAALRALIDGIPVEV